MGFVGKVSFLRIVQKNQLVFYILIHSQKFITVLYYRQQKKEVSPKEN